MKYITFITLLLFISIAGLSAKNFPANGASLHYRLIGFQCDAIKGADEYSLEIAEGYINNEDSFKAAVFTRMQSQGPQIIATVPHWATTYTWRITAGGRKNKTIAATALQHFNVGTISYIDTSLNRLRVSEKTGNYKDMYLFADCNRALYDMDGNALWYLPQAPGLPDSTTPVRDLKLTPQHTITFIANTDAYEIDYDGHLLWQAPDDGKVNGDTSEFYHHEFTRLHNGHYMIAGNEHIRKYLPADFAANFASNENVKKEGDRYYVDVDYGTLIEYDGRKLVWSWKSSEYFKDEDLFNEHVFGNNRLPGFHYNAFYFDERNNVIYNSFRNINTIAKIHYPDGRPVARYGNIDPKNSLFAGQHNCRINKEGNLTLFNNNFIQQGRRDELKPSAVLVLKEVKGKQDKLELLFSFDCDYDRQAEANAKGSGSTAELENGNLLVCMGTVNRTFILNGKEVVWEAFVERKIENNWLGNSCYRVSAVEGAENIRRMILDN